MTTKESFVLEIWTAQDPRPTPVPKVEGDVQDAAARTLESASPPPDQPPVDFFHAEPTQADAGALRAKRPRANTPSLF